MEKLILEKREDKILINGAIDEDLPIRLKDFINAASKDLGNKMLLLIDGDEAFIEKFDSKIKNTDLIYSSFYDFAHEYVYKCEQNIKYNFNILYDTYLKWCKNNNYKVTKKENIQELLLQMFECEKIIIDSEPYFTNIIIKIDPTLTSENDEIFNK